MLGSHGQFWGSLQHNSKGFEVIYLKLGTDTCIGAGKVHLHVGVTGVNFWITWVNFGVRGSIWGSLRAKRSKLPDGHILTCIAVLYFQIFQVPSDECEFTMLPWFLAQLVYLRMLYLFLNLPALLAVQCRSAEE